jgi:hypothetical protein
MAARAGQENAIAGAVTARMRLAAESPPERHAVPGILAVFVDDLDRTEWRPARDAGTGRRDAPLPDRARRRRVVAVRVRMEMFGMAPPDGELFGMAPPDAAPAGRAALPQPAFATRPASWRRWRPRSASTMLPSSIATTRSAMSRMRGSCVTIRIGTPRDFARSRSRCTTSPPEPCRAPPSARRPAPGRDRPRARARRRRAGAARPRASPAACPHGPRGRPRQHLARAGEARALVAARHRAPAPSPRSAAR